MTRCILCPVYHPAGEPRAPEWPPACNGCRERARRELAEIPEAYARVPAALMPGSGGGEHVSGTRTPPLPLRVDVLNLLGPGAAWTHREHDVDQVGTLPPLVLLDQWCRDWLGTCDRRQHLPDPTVTAMVAWLLVGLDTALDEHPAIDEWARDLSQLVRTLRRVAQAHHQGEKAGRCPARLRDDTRCPATLRADPYVDQIACGRCGSTWNRRDGGWLRLRAEQRGWENEAA